MEIMTIESNAYRLLVEKIEKITAYVEESRNREETERKRKEEAESPVTKGRKADPKWMTHKEVCEMLDISHRTLQRYRQKNIVPYSMIGRQIRYPRQAFFKVILPEISPAILSAFLICLTYSIDDFMISYFNCGTVETLPIAIYSMTRKKVSPEIYALSTIMFVVILCIILVSNAMESRSYRRDQKALRGEGV